MYVVTGFIHLLLMLTHTRFVPVVDFSAREQTVAKTRFYTNPPGAVLHLPVETTPAFSLDIARSADKEKLRRILRTEAKKYLIPRSIKRRSRVMIAGKRYLLLGQLRADG